MSGVCAEHLSTPGQWYHDRAGAQVLYFPLPGEDMTKATAVLAVEEVLVNHVGLSKHEWSGVAFEFATWLRPMQGGGFVEQQAGACNVCEQGHPVPSEGCGMNDDYVVTPGNGEPTPFPPGEIAEKSPPLHSTLQMPNQGSTG